MLNRICFEKDLHRSHDLHIRTISEMRPHLEIAEPPLYEFLIARKKKEQMKEKREFEVKLENDVLLRKISSVFQREDEFSIILLFCYLYIKVLFYV